ncbi:nitrate reductase [Ignicoccus islandicus DSM 13165]|uniref:Nitrate reductase n=1 Tax=Ignicoccus islandicus DSM 13165 TaxID=940295 RepID=A0A0U3FP52_9CREN|nr:nitrate reductase [Ignicoccus islandicus DSM 13165]
MSSVNQTRRKIIKTIAIGAAFAAISKASKVPNEQLAAELEGITSKLQKNVRMAPVRIERIPVGPCRFCGTGCGVQALAKVDTATGETLDMLAILGMPKYPVNRGAMCTKAFYIHKALGYGGNKEAYKLRLKKPAVIKDWIIPELGRPPIKEDEIFLAPRVKYGQVSKNYDAKLTQEEHYAKNMVEVDWDTAVKFFVTMFKYALKRYGPHSFAYYGSGQLGTEESYVINKLTKGGIHTNNLDGNPRMCMVSAVGGFITSFGADEPEVSYDHIDIVDKANPASKMHATTFFLIGTNTAEAHPIVFGRIAKVKEKNPNAKVILADPRKTRSGAIADLWLPLRWSMDVALMNTLAHIVAFELDHCKVIDVEKGIVQCDEKYVDIKWLKRHADFAVIKNSQKTWAKKDYNTKYNKMGELNEVWDMGTTASAATNYGMYPSVGKKYASEEDVERDWWKGFALYLKFLETYKPEIMAKLLFGDQAPLINKKLAEKLVAAGELAPEKVNLGANTPFVEIDPVEALRLAAKWMANEKGQKGRTLVFWTMGVNQKMQGVHTVNTIINFLALTGQLLKWGAGALSLTGQPNACGGIRDQGGLAHVLPYGRLIAVKAAREEVENIWRQVTAELMRRQGYSESEIQKTMKEIYVHPSPGPHVIEMFRRVNAGQLKIVWIAETNPGQSLPNVYKYRVGMAKPHDDCKAFPFVVVSDIYPTRTTDVADLVFPAAAYAEKEFFYGCTERRYSVVNYTIRPPGEAIGDHVIFALVGKALEDEGLVPKGIVSGFFPENVDEAAKKEGISWVQYVVKKSQEKKWHMKFLDNIYDVDILSLSKNTYYDFSYAKREIFRKKTWEEQHGYRWPWPWTYAVNKNVKERYDKYESATRYAYPYDPLMPEPKLVKEIYNKIKNMNDPEEIKHYLMSIPDEELHPIHKHKWVAKAYKNPALLKWVLKNIVEEIDDIAYKEANKLNPEWYGLFYAKPTGRMTVWARPWLPVNIDHNTGVVTINDNVIIAYEKLDADAVFKGKINIFEAPKGPFVVAEKHVGKPVKDVNEALEMLKTKSWGEMISNPEYKKYLESIFAIALAPAEVPGFKLEYKLENGQTITLREAEPYWMVATTGRVIEHWHTGTMTLKVPELRRVKPSAYIEINVDTAKALGIKDGDWVAVESPRGKIVLKAKVLDPRTGLGGPRYDYTFIPWFDPNKLANAITLDNYDVQPYFFQPDFKTCAAYVRKARPDEIPTSEKEQTASAKYNIYIF